MRFLYLGCLFISFHFFTSSCSKQLNPVALSQAWTVQQLEKGLLHYELSSQFVDEMNAYQNVNVIHFQPHKSNYRLKLYDDGQVDSLSSMALRIANSKVGLNGTYYEKEQTGKKSTSFLKIDNNLIDSVEVASNSRYAWKHEGAFYMKDKAIGIIRGNNSIYQALNASAIISGSPLLIENYQPSGAHFVKAKSTINLHQLAYENPDRHQGVRHPRSAIAILEDGSVLLIAVDGRSQQAAGMNAKELTAFLVKHFNPKDALNLDGGGSTTLWIKNDKRSKTGVVNYPTDNKQFDHDGQRKIRNALFIIHR